METKDSFVKSASIIAKTLCLLSDTSEAFRFALNPSSDDLSIIFDSPILPEEINLVGQVLEDTGFAKYVVEENVIYQSFLGDLIMAVICVNTKKNTIKLTFNT